MVDLKNFQKNVYEIIGCAMRVHNILNFGLLEAIYRESLAYEIRLHGIDCEEEQEIDCYYGKHLLKKSYRMDIVAGDIIIELKAVREIRPEHRAQLCNYLRLTKKPLGLLINFGGPILVGERWAYDEITNECYVVDKEMKRLPMDEYSTESDWDEND